MTQPITLRPEVAAFATLMEQQLRANDHKTGWKTDSSFALWSRLLQETIELNQARTARNPDSALIGREAADVANFAMMVADVMGGLPVETIERTDGTAIDRIAARLAAADGLHWAEVCGYEAIPPLSNCDSSTCVAAHFEDHDADYAREQYRKYARIAFEAGEIPDDVRCLVIAARNVVAIGTWTEKHRELDKAAEAFASRVDYDDQQERFDFDISDDGVMTALPSWQRDDKGTFLRLMLVDGHATTQADIASWTDEQCQQADIWSWTTHLSASDHDDIKVPPRPDFLRPGDHAAGRHPITGEPNA